MFAIPWITFIATPLALAGISLSPIWSLAASSLQFFMFWIDGLSQFSWANLYLSIPPLPLIVLSFIGALVLILAIPWRYRIWGIPLFLLMFFW